MRRITLVGLAAACILLAADAARADVDVVIRYGVLERMLARQMFTQDGRRYVKGTREAHCSFAYLEKPAIDAVGGRLRIRARFSGRSALDVFGKCVGFGDDFQVEVVGEPYFGGGAVRLKGVSVRAVAAGFYARRVAAALAASVPDQFAYPLEVEMRHAVEGGQPDSGQARAFRRFEVRRIEVRRDALVLSMAFEIEIRE